MNQRYDAFGFGAVLLAVALFIWSGLAGPVFQIEWRMDAAAAAGWVQALVSALALVGVFFAAIIPIRAERAAKAREKSLRAGGIALLIIPEMVNLLGAMQDVQGARQHKRPAGVAISLVSRKSRSALPMGETGGRILQTIGLLNGMAAQTERYYRKAGNPPRLGAAVEGALIWQNHCGLLGLAIMAVCSVLRL